MNDGGDLLVGVVALILLPVIGLRLYRGLRDGRLPVYRTYLNRAESGSKFALLALLHAFSFVLIAFVAAELLFNLGLRDMI